MRHWWACGATHKKQALVVAASLYRLPLYNHSPNQLIQSGNDFRNLGKRTDLEWLMIIIIMGVSAAGKTTIGKLLAQDLCWHFYEGDDYHPPSNVEKMSSGIPLTDDDRWPWLDSLRRLIDRLISDGRNAVIACSALRQAYRDRLQQGNKEVVFIYLKGDYGLIRTRLEDRQEHFMNADLLESQFRTLEEPESATTLEVGQEPETIVRVVKENLGL